MASDPSLGFAVTRQGTHVQVIAKGDGGVSLVDLRTLAALDFGALLELLDRAAMPGVAAPADGVNKVERLARDLIGIPDGL